MWDNWKSLERVWRILSLPRVQEPLHQTRADRWGGGPGASEICLRNYFNAWNKWMIKRWCSETKASQEKADNLLIREGCTEGYHGDKPGWWCPKRSQGEVFNVGSRATLTGFESWLNGSFYEWPSDSYSTFLSYNFLIIKILVIIMVPTWGMYCMISLMSSSWHIVSDKKMLVITNKDHLS